MCLLKSFLPPLRLPPFLLILISFAMRSNSTFLTSLWSPLDRRRFHRFLQKDYLFFKDHFLTSWYPLALTIHHPRTFPAVSPAALDKRNWRRLICLSEDLNEGILLLSVILITSLAFVCTYLSLAFAPSFLLPIALPNISCRLSARKRSCL